MIFKKFHAWRIARACIKCSSWIFKEDGQEQHLTCKSNSCFFSFGRNGRHFGHKCLPFSLTWQVSCWCNCWYFGWILAINRWWIWEKMQEWVPTGDLKKKKRYLTFWSSSTIKNYSISIIFSITLFFYSINFRSTVSRW